MPNLELKSKIQELPPRDSSLLKHTTRTITKWSTLHNMIIKKFGKYTPKYKLITVPVTDVDALLLWPERNKVDLSLRRSRYPDFYTWAETHSDTMTVLNYLTNCKYDYFSVCNIVISSIVYGYEWFENLKLAGIWTENHDTMITKLKYMGNMVKLYHADFNDWQNYTELAGLTGYKNLPEKDFDYDQEVKNLAHAGEKHPWTENGFNFEEEAISSLYKLPERWNKKMSLLEFIKSKVWITNGASSEGYYTVEFFDKEGAKTKRVKCRKNMVMDILTPEEIYELCMHANFQTNNVLVKSELGKVRLAVSSDFATYINMCYMNYCASDFYLQWKNVVSGESTSEQIDRLNRMVLLCLRLFGMPFDYQGFDHQPTTEELLAIIKVLIRVGRQNAYDLEEYDRLASNTIEGFKNSTLKSKNPQTALVLILKVLGGLMSGLFLTAFIGNGWNRVVTDINKKIIHNITNMNMTDLEEYIKGDDSSFYSDDKYKLQLMEYVYKRLNIKAAPEKFSIMFGNNEFLRTWVRDRAYGYPGRVLPGLMQRKPWSNTPWSGTMVLDAIYSDVQILRRRIGDKTNLDALWLHMSNRWCSLHNIPTAAISIPKSLGGLGCGYWNGEDHIEPKIFQVPKMKLTITNNNGYRKKELIDKLKLHYNISLEAKTAEVLASDEMSANLVSDDIPIISKELRDKWKYLIKQQSFNIYKKKISFKEVEIMAKINIDRPIDEPGTVKDTIYANKSSFGSMKHEVDRLLSIKPVLKKLRISLKDAIRTEGWFPDLKQMIDRFKNYHIGELLDWLGGSISMASYSINPLFYEMYQKMITKKLDGMKKRGRMSDLVCGYWVRYLEPVVTGWALYQRTGQW